MGAHQKQGNSSPMHSTLMLTPAPAVWLRWYRYHPVPASTPGSRCLLVLGLAALPQSLQRLELSFARGYSPGQSGLDEVRVLDLAVLRGLPQLTSVVLGPRIPLTCFVPAGLSCLTELDINSYRGMVFEDGLWLPGLQRLALVPLQQTDSCMASSSAGAVGPH